MIIRNEFRIIEPELHDKIMVPEFEVFYHFDEINSLLGMLEMQRSAVAAGYVSAQAVGNTVMMAYSQYLLGQIQGAMQEVAGVAADQLHIELDTFLSQRI